MSKVRGEPFTWEQARDMTFKDIAKNVEVSSGRLHAAPKMYILKSCTSLDTNHYQGICQAMHRALHES